MEMVRLEKRCVLHFSQTLMSINLHMWILMASHILYHLGQWVYCQTVDMWPSTQPRFDFHFYRYCEFFWLIITCAILKSFCGSENLVQWSENSFSTLSDMLRCCIILLPVTTFFKISVSVNGHVEGLDCFYCLSKTIWNCASLFQHE